MANSIKKFRWKMNKKYRHNYRKLGLKSDSQIMAYKLEFNNKLDKIRYSDSALKRESYYDDYADYVDSFF